ncbi:MAG: hypothetical protein IJY23_05925 [Clostridia bacterium]|nr:hypothetical protein [Clostridia bacterium]
MGSALYILSMLALVAFSSFASYDAERERSSRFVFGIILLASLITPVIDSLSDYSLDFYEYESEKFDTVTDEVMEKSFCRGIKLAVVDEFSLSEGNVEVTCEEFDKNTVTAKTIRVTLSGRAAISDIPSIRRYVQDMELGDCETEVKFEKDD